MIGIKAKNKNKKPGRFKLRLLIIPAIILMMAAAGLIAYFLRDLPNPSRLSTFAYPESSQLFDRNGSLLYEIYSDQNRVSVPLTEIPDNLKKATIAIEDANFYQHGGFDFKGILRGMFRTVFEGRLQGGSTLSQQLVKNGLLTPERTVTRKIKEAVLTIAVELTYSKDQILEMYFNQTPYGGTTWGAQAAAKSIFNKNVNELDLAECALLAGLPGSPSRYSPFTNPDLAKKRQELVLKRMTELKMISQADADKASKETLNYHITRTSISAPHFVFYIKELLTEKYGSEMVGEGGLKVKTSLDLGLQDYVQATVATEVAKLAKVHVTNGAAVVTDPKNGQLLAMVGSKDYFADDIDGKYNVTTALRQPGSSIKPLNYAVGLELGNITAASVFNDEPICFPQINQKAYCPTNYGNSYHGIQTTRNALANSLNIPAVETLKINGVETFMASASAMGISTFNDPSQYGLSLTLGAGEVKMVDMNTAFGVFANSGVRQDLQAILTIDDRKGKRIFTNQTTAGLRVLSRETAFLIQNILSDDGARSMVFGRGSMLNIKKHPEVAVKTGTTNDMRDNWTIGFTPDYVTAVWVGNNDNSKMSSIVSGTTGAAPIWNKIMTYILKDKEVKNWVRPASIVSVNVCNLTGQLPPDEGCETHNEYFKSDFVPTKHQSLQQNILIDKTTGQALKIGDFSPNAEWQVHPATIDVMGQAVCLDCPGSATPTPTMTP